MKREQAPDSPITLEQAKRAKGCATDNEALKEAWEIYKRGYKKGLEDGWNAGFEECSLIWGAPRR